MLNLFHQIKYIGSLSSQHWGGTVGWNPSSWKTRTCSLKQKCFHFDEIFITGCTGSCQNDIFQCSQWWKFNQNDIFISVFIMQGMVDGDLVLGRARASATMVLTKSFQIIPVLSPERLINSLHDHEFFYVSFTNINSITWILCEVLI